MALTRHGDTFLGITTASEVNATKAEPFAKIRVRDKAIWGVQHSIPHKWCEMKSSISFIPKICLEPPDIRQRFHLGFLPLGTFILSDELHTGI